MANKLPVAEIFESVQGEGEHSGIAMTFVRLAGCTVGKPYSADERQLWGLESYQERCTDWDGKEFSCDTNYRMAEKKTVTEIVYDERVQRARWVSITGGEPLMHDIAHLVDELHRNGISVHIETSGTIHKDLLGSWVCVSPKYRVTPQMLARADEIRVLVDKSFDEDKFMATFRFAIERGKLWISPVNNLATLDVNNIKKCLELQHKYRGIKLTTQMHKVWGVR